MNRFKRALLQAVALIVIGFVVAFAHNALSVNGINPFRRIADVPVMGGPDAREDEGIRFIDLDEVVAYMDMDVVLLDARTEAEYEEEKQQFLEEQEVAFDYVYVDLLQGQEREEVLEQIRRWNPATSFPTVVVDDGMCVVGYKPERIKAALGL